MPTKTRSKPIVIGFTAKSGSGKTTSANYVVEKYVAKKVSFAAPLKEFAREVFDFSYDQVYGDAVAKEAIDLRYGISPRCVMQRIGASARNIIDPNIWINGCFTKINNLVDSGANLVVVEDVRYLNEVNAIINSTDFTGYVVKLVCTNRISTDDSSHPSESEVDLVDSSKLYAVISSELSEDSLDLKKQLDIVIEKLLNEKT